MNFLLTGMSITCRYIYTSRNTFKLLCICTKWICNANSLTEIHGSVAYTSCQSSSHLHKNLSF
jgi:hypothetical protein